MKMMTKAIIAALPKLYAQEKVADPIVYLKFFNPCGAATWYITEGTQEGDDWRFFGLCDLYGDGGELGNVMLSELESIRTKPFGLKIERDLHWTPCPLSQIKGK
jgi:hypothetical protein